MIHGQCYIKSAKVDYNNNHKPDTVRDATVLLPGSRCRKMPGMENTDSAMTHTFTNTQKHGAKTRIIKTCT